MIIEKYKKDELRTIYKDAKYNWSKTISEPLDLAYENESDATICLSKEDYKILVYIKKNDNIEPSHLLTINSFHDMMMQYDILKRTIEMVNNE